MTREYKPDLNVLNNNEWTIVSTDKKKKREKIKQQKKTLLQEKIEEFVISIENRNDFVYVLLKDHSIYPSEYYDKLSKEIELYKSILSKIKRCKDVNYFEKKKNELLLCIKNMNKIINKDNFYILVGKGLIENEEGIPLKDLDEYQELVQKYENLINLPKNTSDKLVSKDLEISYVTKDKSYASLFK